MEPEDTTQDFHQLTAVELFSDPRQSRGIASYNFENKIVRDAQVVQRLLTQFESYSSSSQIALTTVLRQALEELPTNAKILAQPNILHAAIRICLNSERGRLQDEMLRILACLFRCSTLPDSLLRRILQKVVLDFHDSRLESTIMLTTVRLFSVSTTVTQTFYQSKSLGANEPKGEMNFHGEQDCIIRTRKNILNWPFSKGYTFAVWLYLEKVRGVPESPLGKLFTFHAEGSGGLEAYFVNDKLYYRVLGAGYTEPHANSNGMYLCSIEPKKWQFLAIEHEQSKIVSRSKLNVYLEKRLVNTASIDPPKPSSSAKTSIRFFNGLYCRSSSIALFLSPVGARVEELSKNMNSIEYLKDPKALVFEARGGKLQERSGFGWSDCLVPVRSRRMNCTHMLPFFYLLRFMEPTEQPLLKELLQIIIYFLRNDRENQQEAERINFFKLLANLMVFVPDELFDSNTIGVLLQIKHNITEQKLLDQFVCQFLWKLLKGKIGPDRKLEVFNVLKSCFTQNLTHFSSQLGFDELLNYVATFQVRSVNCCEKHQRAMHPQQGFVENKQQLLLAGLLQLIELIFCSTRIDLALELPKLARLLCLNFSPCFQLAILCSLKKVLTDKLNDKLSEEHTRKTLKVLVEKKVHLIFLYLISNSLFVDVKAQSLKMIYFLVSHKASSSLVEAELTHYISEVFWNVNEVRRQPISPVKEVSLQKVESKGEVEPEGPQAPSMSHRRNPNIKFSFAEPKETVVMQEEKTVDPEVSTKPVKKKKTFSLNIDTDKINELYSYGGEGGRQVVVDAEEEEEQIENIRKLARKCLKAMKPNEPIIVEQVRRPDFQSVRENKPINFPVAALNSTRNQDLVDRKPRNFGPAANLRIIEESEKSASQKKSKPRSEVSEEETRRTPKVSPSQKKQEHENMLTLYSALLECIFHRPTAKIIAPCPRIMSMPCFDMMLGWGHFFSNEIKTIILTDLTIMTEQKPNMELLASNKEVIKFILDSIYCALASSSEELLKGAVALLRVLFQHIFLNDEDAMSKFAIVSKWPRQPNDPTYDACLCALASRYCLSRVIDAIHEIYAQNSGNDVTWENNFNALCLVVEQMVYSHCNPICPSIEVRQDNGLTYLLSSSAVPPLIREYFKHDWLDYILVAKLLALFNKYFTTKSYLLLKKSSSSSDKLIQSMLDNKNNLEALRDCEYYLSSSHQRGTLLELAGLYNAMVQFCHESNMDCEEEEQEMNCVAKLLLLLGEMMPTKIAASKRQQIIDMFLLLLKTSVCVCHSNDLIGFLGAVRVFITSKFVLPGNVDSNCYLNLITLEIVNSYFGNRSTLFETRSQPQSELELKALLNAVVVEPPRKIEEKQFSQIQPNKEDIRVRFETEVYEITTQTVETEKERYFSTFILEEADTRKARSCFRRIWKGLRCYNSVWSHPKFVMQVDTLYNKNIWNFDRVETNPAYTLRINKQESKSKARFLLTARLIEPKMVQQFEESFKTPRGGIKLEKPLGFLLKAIGESEDKKETASGRYLSLGRGLLETFYPLRGDPDNPLVFKKVYIIKTLTVRTGSLCITNEKILFVYANYEEKESHYSMARYRLHSDSSLFKEWPLANIKEVFRRRYVNRRSAIEIFFVDGKSVFFYFPDGDSDEFSKKILRLGHRKCPQLIHYKSLDPKKILESSSLMKRWGTFETSNFEYLMQVNCLSGRSYKDVTQYPVFPWVLTSFAEKIDLVNPNSYRALDRNMGSLGSEARIANFQERYNCYDPHLGGEKFHFGTHYSSPGIIYHYLIRLSPFTEGAKELQGGKFDFADRLFFSIEDSWKNCTSEYSDVRELIPQFFYLPDMFLNESHHDFGTMQNKRRVNNVELPQWARDNPYLYVAKLRKAFELDFVSRHLNEWIDLIYGWKQRGEQAVKALNIFVQITYEDSVNFESMTDPKLRKAIESQILNFGQTPSQIFTKPHPLRSQWSAMNFTGSITETNFAPKVYRPTHKKQSERWLEVNPLHQPDESIIRLKWIKDSKLICIYRNGNIINYKWYSQGLNRIPFQCAIEKELKLERLAKSKYDPTEYYDTSLDLEDFPLEVICSGQFLLVGGICEGKLVQLRVESGDLVERYRSHTQPITTIRSAKDNFVVTGDSSGCVILWRIEGEKLQVNHRFTDHSQKVNAAFISSELRAFATCGDDGSVQLYNIITGKRLRAYFHPEGKPISNILLTTCPLACLVMFCSRDRMIFTYSINGQLIQRLHEADSGSLLVPTLIRDMRSLEYVIYGNEKGEVVMRDLPFLDSPRKFVVARDATVTSICVSKDLRYLICSCSDGQMSVITDPNIASKTF